MWVLTGVMVIARLTIGLTTQTWDDMGSMETVYTMYTIKKERGEGYVGGEMPGMILVLW